MYADFAEVGTADFSEICLLVSGCGRCPRQARLVPGLGKGVRGLEKGSGTNSEMARRVLRTIGS